MKQFSLALLLVGHLFQAHAALFLVPNQPPGVIMLMWDKSPDPTVNAYNIYLGLASASYTNRIHLSDTNTCTITLQRGVTYFFAATAIDVNRLESDFSNEISWTVPSLPAPPSNFGATNVVILVGLDRAVEPDGPWGRELSLFSIAEIPGFYRSTIAIAQPSSAAVIELRKSLGKMRTVPPPPVPPVSPSLP